VNKIHQTQLSMLIQGCRKNDRAAQQQLYRAFQAWAYVICLRYTNDQFAAQECVQDGFFKVFTKINRYGGEQSFESWFKKILINTCIDLYRSRLNEPFSVELNEDLDEAIMPETLINADAEHLLNFVRQLPPAYQTTFNLYVVEGFEYHEIAEILDISIGTVKSNLFKARQKLKTLLIKSNTTPDSNLHGRPRL
jgi:RNA polymerase sigma factor (sigma-70 family)